MKLKKVTAPRAGKPSAPSKKQEYDEPESPSYEVPSKLKKMNEKEEFEHFKKNLTLQDIKSDSKSNKHIIYKFLKKGF